MRRTDQAARHAPPTATDVAVLESERQDGWLARRIGRQNAGRVLLLLAGIALVAMLVVLHLWLFF